MQEPGFLNILSYKFIPDKLLFSLTILMNEDYSFLIWSFLYIAEEIKNSVYNVFLIYCSYFQTHEPAFDGESIASLIIWFCCVLYSSMRTASNSQASKLTMSDKVLLKDDSSKSHFLSFGFWYNSSWCKVWLMYIIFVWAPVLKDHEFYWLKYLECRKYKS